MKRKAGLSLLAALGLVVVLSACGEAPPENASPSPAATVAIPTPDASPIANPFANLPAPYKNADYKLGKRQFGACKSCHHTDREAGHRVGPNLFGMFGRTAGSLESFPYSKAMTAADFIWTPEMLDQWLANPKQFLKGNRMSFIGIANADQRRNVIAYLMVETAEPPAVTEEETMTEETPPSESSVE